MSNNNNNSVIEALVESYEKTPQVGTIVKSIVKGEKRMIVGGLAASSAAVVISALMKQTERVMMVIMNDADEAGYMYNDMAKMMGEERVMYFPSSYRQIRTEGCRQRDNAHGGAHRAQPAETDGDSELSRGCGRESGGAKETQRKTGVYEGGHDHRHNRNGHKTKGTGTYRGGLCI